MNDRLQSSGHAGQVTRRGMHLLALREETREADFVFSTDDVDRYGDVVEQTWRLDDYQRNPVVLWAHKSQELPVGKAKNVSVRDGGLRGTVKFATADINPFAEHVWRALRDGYLNAGSVGFLPHEVWWEDDVMHMGDNELLEFSIAPVPANPNALQELIVRSYDSPRKRHQKPETVPLPEAEPEAPAEVAPEPAAGPAAEPVEFVVELVPAPADASPEPDGSEPAPEPSDAPAPAEAPASAEPEPEPAEESTAVALLAEVTALRARCEVLERLVSERTSELAEAHRKLGRHELAALVGVKITPAEVPVLLGLRDSAPSQYQAALAAVRGRPDMPTALNRTHSALGPDASPLPATAATDDDGQAYWALVQRAMARGE